MERIEAQSGAEKRVSIRPKGDTSVELALPQGDCPPSPSRGLPASILRQRGSYQNAHLFLLICLGIDRDIDDVIVPNNSTPLAESC